MLRDAVGGAAVPQIELTRVEEPPNADTADDFLEDSMELELEVVDDGVDDESLAFLPLGSFGHKKQGTLDVSFVVRSLEEEEEEVAEERSKDTSISSSRKLGHTFLGSSGNTSIISLVNRAFIGSHP